MRHPERAPRGSGLPAGRPAPVVTLSGASLAPPPLGAPEPERPVRRPGAGAAALVVGALALLAAAVVLGPTGAAEPPRLAADVQVVADQVLNSQSGVLVVPVEVANRGAEVTVASTITWAEPVRQEPATTGNRRVAAGGTGRVVALLQPDCSLLSPSQGIPFVATLVVSLQGAQQQSLELRVDLGQESVVTTRIAAYCQAAR